MDRKENFSYEGLETLFNFLEEDSNNELDIIALCCEFREDSIDDILKDYDMSSLEELQEETIVLKVNESRIIIVNF